MLDENSITEFKANLRGGVIEPHDKSYDEARKVYNGMIHKKPRLIARCADVADVIRSVNFAREQSLLLAIRSGGHNAGGLGICDDGLVIDLAPMKYTRVDPTARTVTAGGGCRARHSKRNYFYDRRWRFNARRRRWSSHPQVRSNHR